MGFVRRAVLALSGVVLAGGMVTATSGSASAAPAPKATADSASSLAAASTAAACPAQGTRFKTSDPTVYLVGPNNVLYRFENAGEYFNLYTSYSGIVTVSNAAWAACEAQSRGGIDWPLALVQLVKANGDPRVYIYDAKNGGYRWIPSQSVFDKYGFSSSKIASYPSFPGATGPNWT